MFQFAVPIDKRRYTGYNSKESLLLPQTNRTQFENSTNYMHHLEQTINQGYQTTSANLETHLIRDLKYQPE